MPAFLKCPYPSRNPWINYRGIARPSGHSPQSGLYICFYVFTMCTVYSTSLIGNAFATTAINIDMKEPHYYRMNVRRSQPRFQRINLQFKTYLCFANCLEKKTVATWATMIEKLEYLEAIHPDLLIREATRTSFTAVLHLKYCTV